MINALSGLSGAMSSVQGYAAFAGGPMLAQAFDGMVQILGLAVVVSVSVYFIRWARRFW